MDKVLHKHAIIGPLKGDGLLDIELLRAVGLQMQRIRQAAQKIEEGIIEICTEMAHVEAKRTPERDLSRLTERQREIFKMIALDTPTAEIAKRLDISRRTVDAHCQTMRVNFRFETVEELKEFAKQTLKG